MKREDLPRTIVKRTDRLATQIAVGGAVLVVLLAMSSGLSWFSPGVASTLSSLAFVATVVAAAGIAARVRRRTRRILVETDAKACVFCLYDLRGMGSTGKCPECGDVYDLTKTVKFWRESYPGLPYKTVDIEDRISDYWNR